MITRANISQLLKGEKAWVLADQALFSLGSLATTLLLARNLPIAMFGIYSQLVLLSFLALALSSALIISPLQVLLAKQTDKNSYISATTHMQLLVCFVMFLVSAVVALFFQGITTVNAWLVAGYITGFVLMDYFRKLFLALGQPKHALIVDAVNNVMQVVLLGLLILNKTLTMQHAFVVMAFTYVPAIVYAAYILAPQFVSIQVFASHVQQHIHTGKWYVYTATLQWFGQNFLITAAGVYLGAPILAAFRLAQSVFGVFNSVLQIFENYTLPKASVVYHNSSIEIFSGFLKKLTVKSIMLFIPIILGMIFFADDIFMLAGGSQYVAYAFILQYMAALYLLVFISNPVRIAIRVLLLNKQFFNAHILSFAVSVGFAFFVIERFTIYGVIGGLICNQLVMLLYWQFVLTKKNVLIWR